MTHNMSKGMVIGLASDQYVSLGTNKTIYVVQFEDNNVFHNVPTELCEHTLRMTTPMRQRIWIVSWLMIYMKMMKLIRMLITMWRLRLTLELGGGG